MANTIKIKNSGTASNVPSSLEHGELAINYADGLLFYKNSSDVISQFSSGGGASVTISDTAPSSPSAGDLWYESDTGDFFVYYDSYWVELGADPPSSSFLSDLDGDTLIQVEESNDEDKIRFDTAGSERMIIDNTGKVGIGTTTPSTTLDVNGSLSKNSGSFKIPHPLPAMAETHNLVHSFVEAPQADNLYRGRVALVDGAATVDLDDAAGMTTGTFELLNRDLQCFIVNNEGWTAVRGSVSGSTLTIMAQDAACVDTVDWLVVGERHDQHMYDTEWTDDDGRVIVEPVVENTETPEAS